MKFNKYKSYPVMELSQRQWPDQRITQAPQWCSVDLRDGNQALPIPMSVEKKLRMYNMLRRIGFKEIEVSFPSASNTDFAFVRRLIDDGLDQGIALQVLTQSREPLIRRTFESIAGCRRAIVHLYNSTSVQQRQVVFRMEPKEIIQIAVEGARLIKEIAADSSGDISFEYSPESFTVTDSEFARQICEEVLHVWQPTAERKVIINLPATVEMSTPNVYADQIEWFHRNLSGRDRVVLSLHAHNDRGTAVAATELALMAGADRVEGTLFGNGERTGNVDILTLAMNLYSQGIDPGLSITDVNEIMETYEYCTELKINQRHPWVGELVYTAFSGSHQDAISKGLKAYEAGGEQFWEVPYLPIDPHDLGRQYEAVIRINSQSGKGGVAFVMDQEYGYHLPKAMHPEFGGIIKEKSDATGRELTPEEIMNAFQQAYLEIKAPYSMGGYHFNSDASGVAVEAEIIVNGAARQVRGQGNGPISAFFDALRQDLGITAGFETYEEHALGSGADTEAVAYIELVDADRGWFGVGKDSNTTTASFKAILCALNRMEL